jgi:hypothetical protein
MSKYDDLIQRIASAAPSPPTIDDADSIAIEAEVDDVIATIAAQPDIRRAETALFQLGDIQELLAKLAFKYRVSLSDRLSSLVREFDRSDDFHERRNVYELCKKGQFLCQDTGNH